MTKETLENKYKEITGSWKERMDKIGGIGMAISRRSNTSRSTFYNMIKRTPKTIKTVDAIERALSEMEVNVKTVDAIERTLSEAKAEIKGK